MVLVLTTKIRAPQPRDRACPLPMVRYLERMMTAISNVASAPETVLVVTNRSGVWNVKINDRFYGDYVRQEWALEAASDKQREIIAGGGRARVAPA